MTSILGGAMLPPIKSRFGARPSMMAACLVVVGGGIVAGLAPNVGYILGGRAIQGIGEGFLLALSYSLVRELFDNALMPRVAGVEAVTWAVAVFLGPLLGGWLTDLGTWRFAFLGSAALPLPMMALGWVILRGRRHAPMRQTAPLLRLSLLAVGVMAIAVADRLSVFGIVSVLVGIALISLTLAVDRRARHKLFPSAFPGIRHPVSLGTWVLTLMALSEAAVYVYGPYILQLYRGLGPTMAGYFGAIHALAWALSAMLVAPLPARWHSLSILAGPTSLALGLAGLAVTLADSPLPVIAVAMVLIGTGFGVSYAFLTQRIMATIEDGEEDATVASMSTLWGMGGAVSAAVAGLVGNGLGLDGPLRRDVIENAAVALFGGGAVVAAIGIVFAWRLVAAFAAHRTRASAA
jgi:predicted MFS family arabinose efflux permease